MVVLVGGDDSASGERGREQGKRGRARESEAVRSGLRGDVQPIQSDAEEAGGGGKQEVEARRCARVGTRRSPVGEEDDRGGGPGGLGRLLAGPACCGWAAQGGAPGKPLLLLFLFSIFF